jgi:hypothetical protein
MFPTFARLSLVALFSGTIRHDPRAQPPDPLILGHLAVLQPLLPPLPRRYGGRQRVDDRAAPPGHARSANARPSCDEDQLAAGTVWGLAHLVNQVASGSQRSGHLVPVAKAQRGL